MLEEKVNIQEFESLTLLEKINWLSKNPTLIEEYLDSLKNAMKSERLREAYCKYFLNTVVFESGNFRFVVSLLNPSKIEIYGLIKEIPVPTQSIEKEQIIMNGAIDSFTKNPKHEYFALFKDYFGYSFVDFYFYQNRLLGKLKDYQRSRDEKQALFLENQNEISEHNDLLKQEWEQFLEDIRPDLDYFRGELLIFIQGVIK